MCIIDHLSMCAVCPVYIRDRLPHLCMVRMYSTTCLTRTDHMYSTTYIPHVYRMYVQYYIPHVYRTYVQYYIPHTYRTYVQYYMPHTSFVSWNTRSIDNKLPYVQSLIYSHSIDICVSTERTTVESPNKRHFGTAFLSFVRRVPSLGNSECIGTIGR